MVTKCPLLLFCVRPALSVSAEEQEHQLAEGEEEPSCKLLQVGLLKRGIDDLRRTVAEYCPQYVAPSCATQWINITFIESLTLYDDDVGKMNPTICHSSERFGRVWSFVTTVASNPLQNRGTALDASRAAPFIALLLWLIGSDADNKMLRMVTLTLLGN